MDNEYLRFVTRHGLADLPGVVPPPFDPEAVEADPTWVAIASARPAAGAAMAAAKKMAAHFKNDSIAADVGLIRSFDPVRLMGTNTLRPVFLHEWAFAVPSPEVIAAIADLGPVVEVGAGLGYWAGLLRAAGADVVAFDHKPGIEYGYGASATPRLLWSEVVAGGPGNLVGGGYDDRTLLLVWPPYADPMADDAVRVWGGKNLVYVGEGSGGCTADDAFHEYVEAHFDEVDVVNIPRYPSVHDRAYFYRRKT